VVWFSAVSLRSFPILALRRWLASGLLRAAASGCSLAVLVGLGGPLLRVCGLAVVPGSSAFGVTACPCGLRVDICGLVLMTPSFGVSARWLTVLAPPQRLPFRAVPFRGPAWLRLWFECLGQGEFSFCVRFGAWFAALAILEYLAWPLARIGLPFPRVFGLLVCGGGVVSWLPRLVTFAALAACVVRWGFAVPAGSLSCRYQASLSLFCSTCQMRCDADDPFAGLPVAPASWPGPPGFILKSFPGGLVVTWYTRALRRRFAAIFFGASRGVSVFCPARSAAAGCSCGASVLFAGAGPPGR